MGAGRRLGTMRTLSFLGLDSIERPRLNPSTIRRLAVVNIIGRWPGLVFAAILAFFGVPFNPRDVLLWSLIMVVAGAILAAYDRIVVGVAAQRAAGLDGSGPTTVTAVSSGTAPPAVRLSRREHEVLRLVAD